MQFENLERHERISEVVEIGNLSPADHDLLLQASLIYDSSLGQGYIPIEDLLKYAKDPNYILLGASIDRKLLGIMLAFPLNQTVAMEFNEAFRKNGVHIFLPEYSTGVIKSLAVDSKFRHLGIGTKLTLAAMNALKDKSCRLYAALSWDSGKPDSSPKMFEKLRYSNVLEVNEYWYEDSVKQQYQCPSCGNPCHCRAIFYLRKVD